MTCWLSRPSEEPPDLSRLQTGLCPAAAWGACCFYFQTFTPSCPSSCSPRAVSVILIHHSNAVNSPLMLWYSSIMLSSSLVVIPHVVVLVHYVVVLVHHVIILIPCVVVLVLPVFILEGTWLHKPLECPIKAAGCSEDCCLRSPSTGHHLPTLLTNNWTNGWVYKSEWIRIPKMQKQS
jgi:hypothetical protein